MFIGSLAILHLIIAALVTGHVLLNKSEVRAAIGWIGLVWLSPLFGAVIYSAFGINRVARRASKINRQTNPNRDVTAPFRYDVSQLGKGLQTLAEVGSQVTDIPLLQGNKVAMLRGGDEAYPAMLAAISDARRSIALTTYIFRPDDIGAQFVRALIDARKRGVQVRVIVDGIGSGYLYSPVVRQLREADISVARFMHDWRPWAMSFINLRNHKKLIVVDGAVGFAGGLNLGVEYTRVGFRRHTVDDVHFRLDGPVVSQLMSSFAEDWNFATGENLNGEEWWPGYNSVGSVVARGISSAPDEDFGSIETILAAALSRARHHIKIVTPYFLPDEPLKFAINLAALRGVQIDLLVPEQSDHFVMDWAMRAHLSFFPVDRVRCLATPKPFDHSKLVTVDGKWCAVGSANWDVRSLRLNFEFMIECYDAATVTKIDTLIGEKILSATPLTSAQLADRSLMIKLRDACARLLLPYL
ncbi:MAG: phospholipase D-like domain-containing protein [Alphaproteobacteria bacterium]|nr:phospholipase D-like domain-containing protein [Alphaproteobacteria bacterium]